MYCIVDYSTLINNQYTCIGNVVRVVLILKNLINPVKLLIKLGSFAYFSF